MRRLLNTNESVSRARFGACNWMIVYAYAQYGSAKRKQVAKVVRIPPCFSIVVSLLLNILQHNVGRVPTCAECTNRR